DKWNVLDITWARRFLTEAKEAKEHDFTALKKKIKNQRANKNLQEYWEGIIYELEKVLMLLTFMCYPFIHYHTNNDQNLAKQTKAKRAHYIGSMSVYCEVTKSARKWNSDEETPSVSPTKR
ncbi:11849_t:CDS:2, partial [Ambispora gerdemannii]